tara:strand:- start:302 stop:841 length:540 start_codon:yes stop_codon:yes gene_type:complete
MKKNTIQLLNKEKINKILIRLAHEIVENSDDLNKVVLIGIRTRGEFLANRIQNHIFKISNKKLKSGVLDVTFHRDDFKSNFGSPKIGPSNIDCNIEGKNIILIDDVLFTGRTTRAAINEIFSYGRPDKVQLAVLIDRGHREIPIKANYVGKNYPTSDDEHIFVLLNDCDNEEQVTLVRN